MRSRQQLQMFEKIVVSPLSCQRFSGRYNTCVMSPKSIQELNAKFANTHVRLVGRNSIREGIYIGSWRTNHYSIIEYSHSDQRAEIQHYVADEILAILPISIPEPGERKQIGQYLMNFPIL